uniref:CSON006353 protein n=1 Tax=Culicoides sonorensis TaxID=179676 RepID=A0A336LYZ1_CULSO
MSFNFYSKFWIATKQDLEKLLEHEHEIEKLKTTRDRLFAHRVFASLYPRYIVLVNNLSDIYDQTLQVQKREIIGKLLEAATRRLQELRNQLSKIEMSEIIYMDRHLIENHLTPQDITILKPFYFPIRRPAEIQNLIDDIKPVVESELKPLVGLDKFRVKLTPEQIEAKRKNQVLIDAVNLIKIHEKARQARVKKNNMVRMSLTKQPKLRSNDEIYYEFYYKPETPMLFPVKRTKYETNSLNKQNVIRFSNFKYYKKPDIIEPDVPQFVRRLIRIRQRLRKSSVKFEVKKEVELKEEEEDEDISIKNENLSSEETKELKLNEIRNRSAFKIQEAWLSYKLKQKNKEEYLKKLFVFGMADERKWDYSQNNKIILQREIRSARKIAFDAAFIKAVQDEKARILKIKSPWIMEDISDHIREWFRTFYYSVQNFDRYPEAFEGGTILVIRGETMDPEEYKLKQAAKLLEKQKPAEQKAKERAQKKLEKWKLKQEKKQRIRENKLKKKRESARLKALEKEGIFEFDFKLNPESRSKAPIEALEKSFQKYENDWYFINELDNPKEDPIMEWITIYKYAEVHKELRPIVDEFMRIEYELLRQALAKDKKKKYRPQKRKKQRKNRRKRRIRKKKKRGFQSDLLKDHTVEELYNELVDLKIIQKYNNCSIDEYIGDMNYKAYEQRAQILDPIHGLQEMKNTLRACILGMGPLNIPKPKSICLAGPPLSGKKFLTYAICSETNAVLFDLSPDKIAKIQDIKYFINLILTMARVLQPTILFINDAHKPFFKKTPKIDMDLNPKKSGKFLVKRIVKQIKKDEKIMLIGITTEPWKSNFKKLKKCYQKIFLIPRMDYGNSFITWRHTLLQKLGVPRDICVSPLAKVTEGLSTGKIIKCVNDTLNIRRRMKFSREDVTLDELLEYFLRQNPPWYPMKLEMFEKYRKWFIKANLLAKKRKREVLRAHPPEETGKIKDKTNKKNEIKK